MSEKIAILASWNLLKVGDVYHIGGTHFTYLQFASKQFERVYLISSVRKTNTPRGQHPINSLSNIEVVELPPVNSYVCAYKNIGAYYKAIKYVKPLVDLIYCRVPDPFCWMPKLLFNMPTSMHYVGDTIDATRQNEKWSSLRKRVMITGYMPEYWLTLAASRRSKVYTNGTHLLAKLNRHGINAIPVISSTVSINDIVSPDTRANVSVPPRMIYIGYLRYAKGMNLLKRLWLKIKAEYPDFKFDIVGNGEMMADIQEFIVANNLTENIVMHGRVDSRSEIKRLLRSADLFVFPSLSEGSPRVVIEAMAEGVPVISTPVGSLPGTFTDGDAIRYFDFDNEDQAYSLITLHCSDPELFTAQRNRAFQLVRDNFTKEKFLSTVYSI